LEEELKIERDVRYRQEKELTNLRLDFDEIEQQLEEATNARDREIEANKRFVVSERDWIFIEFSNFSTKQEVHDLRQKIELQTTENDENQNTFRRRFQDSVTDLTSQVEALSKGKTRLDFVCSILLILSRLIFRYEKENRTFLIEIEELKNEVESLAKGKSQAVSINKELEGRLIEMSGKVDDAIRQLTDANSTKARLVEENSTLTRRIETIEYELTSLQTTYRRAQGDLEEARLHLESEMAVRDN